MSVSLPEPQAHITEFTPLLLAAIHALPDAVAQELVRNAITELAQRAPVIKRTIFASLGTCDQTTVYCLPDKEKETLKIRAVEEVQYPGCGKLTPVSCVNDVYCTARSFYAEEPHIWLSTAAPCPTHLELRVSCEPLPDACYFDRCLMQHRQDITDYAIGLAMNMPSSGWYNHSAYRSARGVWDRFVSRMAVTENRNGAAGPTTVQPRRFI